MGQLREIPRGQTELAASALLDLRSRWRTVAALVDLIDVRLRPVGYRLVGVFAATQSEAIAVAGFRVCEALAWGRLLYLDDLSTLPAHRGAGHADQLMQWLVDEAARQGCEAVHLDSGVGAERAAAHRLYMRHRLRISAHHFQREVDHHGPTQS